MKLKSLCMLTILAVFVSSCGGDSTNNETSGQQSDSVNENRIDWNSIPSDFHPNTEITNFQTDNIERINVNYFGFSDDVEVIYTKDLQPNAGYVKLFTVWKETAKWGASSSSKSDTTLNLSKNGSYECSIQIENKQVKDLKGACYLRMQIFLPSGMEIEVYNDGVLLTKRFTPISVKVFLKKFDDATWSDDKFAVIEEFIGSYSGLSKTPSILTKDLFFVVGDFMQSEEKFKALRRLHVYVSDRDKLKAAIESKFGYFDREEAFKIVGI